MHPAAKDFLDVLEKDIQIFEDAAKNLEDLIPHLVGEDQKTQWSVAREHYRDRAKELRSIAERVRNADWAQ